MVRFSLGRKTTAAEIDATVEAGWRVVGRLRR
jgi:cysteine sulfinate desulfinase/cysteine desulfurase-like protein